MVGQLDQQTAVKWRHYRIGT